MPVGSETIDIVVETLADALAAARCEKRRLEDEVDGLREFAVQHRKDDEVSAHLYNGATAERDDALDKLKYARESIANIEAERNEALRKLAQADGHNKMLRGRVEQLQAELKKAYAKAPRGWERTVAENVAAQAILDSSEPELTAAFQDENEDEYPTYYCQKCSRRTPHRPTSDTPEFFCVECGSVHIDQRRFEEAQQEREAAAQFTAQELANAEAVNEAQVEYERTARGDPTTEECPGCGGSGGYAGAADDPANWKCPRYQDTD